VAVQATGGYILASSRGSAPSHTADQSEPDDHARDRATSSPKDYPMKTKLLSAAVALALAASASALAQQKVEIPKNVFYAGLGPTQYLAKSRLIGSPVVDKAGARIAVVDDIILGSKDDKIDGLIIDAGGKKLGVRIGAAKIETKDGKTTVMLPAVTGEMLKSSLPAFGAKPAAK